MLKIILLGLSVSIDSWAVGAAYNADDIKIPLLTKVIVAVISAGVSLVALLLGSGLGRYINTTYIQMAGGFVLFLIGVKSLWGVYTHREEKNYDTDASKIIEPLEGVILGGVLASDSFSGGLSLCAMGSIAYVFPVVVGVLTYVFLLLADKKVTCAGVFDHLAGAALVILGVIQVLSPFFV
ncbi:MAG: manganese efflux pump [Roseburia sp.]|nr:manganese efflux pump [Roseburia sp.]